MIGQINRQAFQKCFPIFCPLFPLLLVFYYPSPNEPVGSYKSSIYITHGCLATLLYERGKVSNETQIVFFPYSFFHHSNIYFEVYLNKVVPMVTGFSARRLIEGKGSRDGM